MRDIVLYARTISLLIIVAIGPAALSLFATATLADSGDSTQLAISAEDYVQIEQLYYCYAAAIDSDDYATRNALFAAGGSIADVIHGDDSDLHETLSQPLILRDRSGLGGRHRIFDIVLTRTPAGIDGSAFVLIGGVSSPEHALSADTATYRDRFVRTAAGWRFNLHQVLSAQSLDQAARTIGSTRASTASRPTDIHYPASRIDGHEDKSTAVNLTTQDYVEIMQLYAAYSHAIDAGDGAARTATFASGGVFVSHVSGHQPESAMTAGKRTSANGRIWARHLLFNIKITPTAAGADGVAYAMFANPPDTTSSKPDNFHKRPQYSGYLKLITAVYQDKITKAAEGWRFSSRTLWQDDEVETPYKYRKPLDRVESDQVDEVQ